MFVVIISDVIGSNFKALREIKDNGSRSIGMEINIQDAVT
jgi:hypothetical protein